MKLFPSCSLLLLIFTSFSVIAEQDLSDTAVLTQMTEMAEHGYQDAQVTLGDWYYNGRQLDKNYSSAAKYYQLAAAQGHKRAQCVLGGMYFLGKGLSKDATKARYWLGLAADKGMKEAKSILASMNASTGQSRLLQASAGQSTKPVISSLNDMRDK